VVAEVAVPALVAFAALPTDRVGAFFVAILRTFFEVTGFARPLPLPR
jgi:hypothetical protein